MKKIPFIWLYFWTILYSNAQDCNCTIKEVLNNKVISCTKTVGTIVNVSSTSQLYNAINQANASGGNMTILIANGTYPIASSSWYPYITASNVVFRSQSGNRDSVILTGQGMKSVSPGTEIVINAVGNNITIADLTIRDCGNHGISTVGDSTFIHNVRIQNTYEQMIKGNAVGDGPDNGIVQCCLLEYPGGTGPQYYIGGIDIHMGNNWIVRDNVFKNIQSPSNSVAEHAVHFWNNGADNIIERNLIINCDRGIGFGLGSSPNTGGVIKNNMIYNNGSGIFNDVGIGVESSPGTKIYNNTVYVNYANAIEYRFASTVNVDIKNNLTNKQIKARDGAQATLVTNYTNALPEWFVNLSEGDLHLVSLQNEAVEKGTDLSPTVVDDLDKLQRPQGFAYDIGAHEFEVITRTDQNELFSEYILYPNPIETYVSIENPNGKQFSCKVFNILGSIIYENKELESNLSIDCNNWESGLYFCQLNNELNQKSLLKVLKL